MTERAVGIPFRRVPSKSLVLSPWQSQVGGSPGPLAQELPHWDYNAELRLVRSFVVDEAAIRTHCRLAPEDVLNVVVVWRSSGNNVRGRGCVVPLGNAHDPRELTLSADISGQMLAGDVSIATQVVLADFGRSHDILAAQFPGSVLWEDAVRVSLEGTGSRFPMEVVDFNVVHWTPYGAGWFLSWNSEELHLPFLRNVRLFINGSHSAIASAVQATTASPEQAAIRSAIYYDVGRQLVRGVLSNDEFVENHDSFSEGSTGMAVLRMLRVFFPGSKPSALRDMMSSRREYFDGMLQGTLRLFESNQ
jgi:hypothetical protein